MNELAKGIKVKVVGEPFNDGPDAIDFKGQTGIVKNVLKEGWMSGCVVVKFDDSNLGEEAFFCDDVESICSWLLLQIIYNDVMNETTKITLELDAAVVELIEKLTECSIKQLLQAELSPQNVEAFVERMGYNNY
jgi:phage FluMu gp28-like protein